MESIDTRHVCDRDEGGILLAKKFQNDIYDNTVIVGIPAGGLLVALAFSHALSLPLDVKSCHMIKHPANPRQSIGSVSLDEVYFHNCSFDIPQDYLSHQTILHRSSMQSDFNKFTSVCSPLSLQNKSVIVFVDILLNSDMVLAALRSILRQNPCSIKVAAVNVYPDAVRSLEGEVDEILFLEMEKLNRPDRGQATPMLDYDKVIQSFCDYRKSWDEKVSDQLNSLRMNCHLQ